MLLVQFAYPEKEDNFSICVLTTSETGYLELVYSSYSSNQTITFVSINQNCDKPGLEDGHRRASHILIPHN